MMNITSAPFPMPGFMDTRLKRLARSNGQEIEAHQDRQEQK